MTQSDAVIWGVIVALGLGTFAIRFSFLGLIGDRPMPAWLLRALRYTSVAVMPGLVAPLILWPEATGGAPDPARLTAAAVTVAVGAISRKVLWSVLAGVAALYIGLFALD